MNKVCTAERLKYLMKLKNLRQIDILNLSIPFCNKFSVKMNKSDISQYVSGKVEPSQEKLVILGMALNVAESWLMGFDVPMERSGYPNSVYAYTPQMHSLLDKTDFLNSEGIAELIKYADYLLTQQKFQKINVQEKAI